MRYIVPLKLVAIALDLARRVEQGELGRQIAYQQLVDQHGFAGHTANAYLNCYAHLRAGTPMKATVNAAGLALMLEEITKLGADELFKALQALHGHILYLEGLPQQHLNRAWPPQAPESLYGATGNWGGVLPHPRRLRAASAGVSGWQQAGEAQAPG